MRKKRKRKIAMYEKDSRCHWCRRETILTAATIRIDELPENAATIDHLYSNLDSDRWAVNRTNERRLVLACRACNQKRGIVEKMAFRIK